MQLTSKVCILENLVVFDLFWQEFKQNYLCSYMEWEGCFFFSPEVTLHNHQTKPTSLSYKCFSNGDLKDPLYWYFSCLMSLWGFVDKIPRVREADV